ncbi:MAG: cellulase family glycosylhydrolase [Erysipelotrichaceae bacterium]|nr:cellulase family glycosylhydrolase [Erysipelotrichaceae bacterium]
MKEFSGYRKGINFGGWFSQCDHSEKRYDNFIKKDDFRRVARWGLDHVRIPVDYELFLDGSLNYREEGFKRIEDCISWCREYGLNMILDLHKTVGFSFDDGENEEGFFDSEKYQQIFYDLWKEFAKRFARNGNLAFELLNEVTDPKYSSRWNEIAGKAVAVIREYAPDIRILVGGYHNNSIAALKDLDEPYDENVVYNFHCYSPLVFTHQGAYWIDKMDRSFRMKFASSYSDYARLTMEQIGRPYLNTFTEEGIMGTAYFEKEFAEAIRISKERDVPLYCGEYGVIDLASDEDTLEWYRCINSVFEKYGIGRAAWSYKEMDFGLVDAHYDRIRKEIIRLL